MQPIDNSILKMINLGLDLIEKDKYKRMVLGHHELICESRFKSSSELSRNKEWKN